MSWQFFIYAALAVFGIEASLRLCLWALLLQLFALFAVLLIFNLTLGETLTSSLGLAYLGVGLVQVGYVLGFLRSA